MLSEHLKKHSRPDHDSIENSIDLLSFSKDLNKYTNLIEAFYGYYFNLENSLKNFELEFKEVGINLEERAKLALLDQDLKNLGLTSLQISQLPICNELPQLDTFPQAMGVLYVLEGSTLGGQIISKQLAKSQILIDGENRASFFISYGPSTMPMWLSFKKSLDTLSEDKTEEVLIAAKKTFSTMECWLRGQLVQQV